MGARSAHTSANASIGAAAKPPTALAGTVSNGIWWNWNHEIGAVTPPHTVESAIASASLPGIG